MKFPLNRSICLCVATLAATFGSGAAWAGKPFENAKSEHWGVVTRNTIGSPVAELRDGPYAGFGITGASAAPPYGKGSLGMEVAAVPGSVEKVDFGNEVDFYGEPVSALHAIGFSVFQTGENADISPYNMPNIKLEIDPTGSGGYTTMVWLPDPSPVVNEWSGYLDATTTGQWFFTGSFGHDSGCNQTTTCTFSEALSKVPSGTVYSISVGKGRDREWVGAVDGLRLNGKVYDFEADGVKAKGVK